MGDSIIMKNNKFIIVEGKDDQIFFERLLKDFSVKIISASGNQNIFNDGLKNLIKNKLEFDDFRFEVKNQKKQIINIAKILIICDADKSYKETEDKIRNAINIARAEYIFDDAIYILPFNEQNSSNGGILEDLILQAIKKKDEKKFIEITDCAEKYLICLEKKETKQQLKLVNKSQTNRSKLIIQSILAASSPSDDPTYSIGKSFEKKEKNKEKNYLSEDNEEFFKQKLLQKLKESIEKLLN